jgi:hypothetical protein
VLSCVRDTMLKAVGVRFVHPSMHASIHPRTHPRHRHVQATNQRMAKLAPQSVPSHKRPVAEIEIKCVLACIAYMYQLLQSHAWTLQQLKGVIAARAYKVWTCCGMHTLAPPPHIAPLSPPLRSSAASRSATGSSVKATGHLDEVQELKRGGTKLTGVWRTVCVTAGGLCTGAVSCVWGCVLCVGLCHVCGAVSCVRGCVMCGAVFVCEGLCHVRGCVCM